MTARVRAATTVVNRTGVFSAASEQQNDMTLVITAAAPDAIVMGTDSAVVLKLRDAPTDLVYRGLKKAFLWAPMGVGVSMFGTFPTHIEKETFSNWMQYWYVRNVGDTATDPDNLARLLCADLDSKIPPNMSSPVGPHLALWVTSDRYPGTKIPVVVEITQIKRKYTYAGKLGHDALQLIHKHRIDPKNNPYTSVFFAAGLPNLRKREMATLRQLFSDIVGEQVPAGTYLHVLEYVRLLITTVAHLHNASGMLGYVSEPVETLFILPETVYGVSMRF